MAKYTFSDDRDLELLEIIRDYIEGITGALGPFDNWSKRAIANLFFTIFDKTYTTKKGNWIADQLDNYGWLVDNTIIIKVG